MNWGKFDDPLCYLCFHGAGVSSLPLMQEVGGQRLIFYKNVSESHLGKISNKS